MPYRSLGAACAAPAMMLLIVLGALQPGCAAAGQLPVGPAAGDLDLSPFYRWDAALPPTPGALLRTEPAIRQPEITAAAEALRILHTSTDVRWGSGQVPVSGTLYLPRGRAPAGGWPLVAWAHGTLGIADGCAPSWTGFRARDATYLNRWLEAGFAVVATDFQGLGGPGPHPYANWRAEGRSVLDAARAALAVRPGQIANQVLIAGQSQGGGAALGAAMLSEDYASELKILGAVVTGPNSTFPDGPVSLPARNSANMFLSLASGGLRDDGPAIEAIVSPAGRQLLAKARQACTREIGVLARELKVGSLQDTLSIPLDELAVHRIAVTDIPAQRARVPLMIGTGLSDPTIPPMRQYAAAAALCASGNTVVWHRYEGLGHDGALHGSFEDSLLFARKRMAGEAVASTCPDLAAPGPPGPLKPGAPFNDD